MATALTEEQIREVLTRAEEINQAVSADFSHSDLESVVRAAEEAGLPREAVERALQERFGVPISPPKVGQMVFAESSDSKYYVAEVLEASPAEVHVRFMKGGEHRVSPAKIRPANFLPGDRVVCPWPVWGWWTCSVISYDASTGIIKVTDGWGEHETFAITDVRLDPPRAPKTGVGRAKALWSIYLLGLVSGGALGWIGWLLTR